MAKLKVGDNVRFLNSKGGGIVRRIVGKVAWVEGEDGFELPTPIHECVIVSEKDTFIPAYRTPQEIKEEEMRRKEARLGTQSSLSKSVKVTSEISSPPPAHLFLPERPEGELISLYLAWLPEDYATFSNGDMECYLINDSNYHLFFTYALAQSNGTYRLVASGEIERDTKLLIDTFSLSELSERERIHLSVVPYKKGQKYALKEPYSIDFKPDGVKFFKRHCFTDNDFFNEDALIVALIEKDKAKGKREEVSPTLLKEAMESSKSITEKGDKKESKPLHHTPLKKKREEPIEVDLHASHLLTTTQGLSAGDLLQYQLDEFHKVMKEHIHHKGQKIVFIHGKGEGVLRKAILDELKRKYPKASAQDASFQEYGFGATLVTIH
ncbi:hypothetical protein HQ36_06515 [Porphyromonas gingivicanis]|uniref:Smr domain-containing protein n=1 Tax=Porphyromonas gingivicanis TaxID=266762 RepID=A0A0A2G586_9PORP|nr:DUF2027 domain-containing protein [Porphyromonas gingivicanis]KGN97535.1 hypothetical protein HQ36_06515 [Porphyromonas gingivicanis]